MSKNTSKTHLVIPNFSKKDIRLGRNNRFLIQNDNHIGIYAYVDGYMLMTNNLCENDFLRRKKRKKTYYRTENVGFNEIYKVYDTFEDKLANTLLRYSVPPPRTHTLHDLMMVSAVYEVPSYIKLTNVYDIHNLQKALNSDDFYGTILKLTIKI